MLSILCVVSITELGPIIFLRLSEKSIGEYDGIFTSRHYGGITFSDFESSSYFLSYSGLQAQVADSGETYNLAPRNQFCDSTAFPPNGFSSQSVCVMFMDTA